MTGISAASCCRVFFWYVFLNMKVILGLLSTPWYSAVSMKNQYKFQNKKCRQTRVPPEPELSSDCSMYYWCGWSRFTCTVNILLRDFHAVAELRHCASWGCWQHHNLAHCSLFEATGCHASSCSMHHNASACMHYESCQESRVFGKCLLFWDLNPISNREIEFIKNMLRCSVFCTNH